MGGDERGGEGGEGRREERGGEEGEGRGEEAFLVMWPRRLSALNPPLQVIDYIHFFSRVRMHIMHVLPLLSVCSTACSSLCGTVSERKQRHLASEFYSAWSRGITVVFQSHRR